MATPDSTAHLQLLLRYIDHVERTGLGMVPALERHLVAFHEAQRHQEQDAVPAGPASADQPRSSARQASEPPSRRLLEAGSGPALLSGEAAPEAASELSPATAPSPAASPTPATPAAGPVSAHADGAATYVTIQNILPTPAAVDPSDPWTAQERDLADAAIDVAATPVEASTPRSASTAAPAPALPSLRPYPSGVAGSAAIGSGGDDRAPDRVRAFIQEVQRSGLCDHPELEAHLQPLLFEPSLCRGDGATALQTVLTSARAQLASIRALLDAVVSADPSTSPVDGSVVHALRCLRHLLQDALVTFGAGLQMPLRQLMRRQLGRARRLDRMLRIAPLCAVRKDGGWPWAVAEHQALSVVLELWPSTEHDGPGQVATPS